MNTDLKLTAEAWADIVMDNWLDRIDKLGIGYYHSLEESFKHEIKLNGNGLPSQIELSFNYYGKFVDMGVGRGVKLEDVKMNRQEYNAGVGGSRRRAKRWYSTVFYAEVQKLKEILANKYGHIAAITIVENIDDNALRWGGESI